MYDIFSAVDQLQTAPGGNFHEFSIHEGVGEGSQVIVEFSDTTN
jgi:hypothetical protein